MQYFHIVDSRAEEFNGQVTDTKDEADAYLKEMIERYPKVDFEGLEVRLYRDVPSVLRITDAPVDYDGFGTRRIKKVPYDYKPDDARLVLRSNNLWFVDIQVEHLGWQTIRYRSGLHTCLEP